jgi:hypothetical protein
MNLEMPETPDSIILTMTSILIVASLHERICAVATLMCLNVFVTGQDYWAMGHPGRHHYIFDSTVCRRMGLHHHADKVQGHDII